MTTFSGVLAVKTKVVVVDEGHVVLVDHEEALHLCVRVCVCIYLLALTHELSEGKKDQQKNKIKTQVIQLPCTQE